MSRLSITGGTGRKMRGEVALAVMLVAAGVIGVTMVRGASPGPEADAVTTTVAASPLPPGQGYMSIALPAGAHPPHLAPGHVVKMFGAVPPVEGFGTAVVGPSAEAVVHSVEGDPAGSDTIVTVVADVGLAEFLVGASEVRLVITGGTP